VDRLCDIWIESFERTRSVMTSDDILQFTSHDNPEQAALPLAVGETLYLQLRKYLKDEVASGSLNGILEYHLQWISDTTGILPTLHGNEEWYTFLAIVLGTAYGVCTKAFCAHTEGATAYAILPEVAVDSDLLSTHDDEKKSKLKLLIKGLYYPLGVKSIKSRGQKPRKLPVGSYNWVDWMNWLYSLYTGQLFPVGRTNGTAIGYYANGIFVIMDVVLRPSLRQIAINQFHVRYGQPLQIPISDTGFVVAPSSHGRPDVRTLNTSPFPISKNLKSERPDRKIRIDLEPWWEEDPRQVVFRTRVNGALLYTFSPCRLINLLRGRRATQAVSVNKGNSVQLMSCDCNGFLNEISVPESQRWRTFEISQFLDLFDNACTSITAGFDRSLLLKSEDESNDPIFIHAAGDPAAQVLCALWFSRVKVLVASKCLHCAHNGWSKKVIEADHADGDMYKVLVDALDEATDFV
jgi:hypothetical protein